MRGVDLEVRASRAGRRLAENFCFQCAKRGLRILLGVGTQDLAKIMMNGCIVIDDENAPVDESG